MKLLDFCCGAGGAALGYSMAGFEVHGVDIVGQKRYPFKFTFGDALVIGKALIEWGEYDLVHISPPCQAYSDLQKRTKRKYPDLIEPFRELVQSTGIPYVMENVDTAPLNDPVMLCGTMFEGLRVYRHRLFETNWDLPQPEHPKHKNLVFTHDKRKNHYGTKMSDEMFVQVTGGGNAKIEEKRAAMGLTYMTHAEINEAIPPKYTEWIGNQWKKSL
jgi:DNA (cytosine-5)-methyltransferase 1